MTEPTAGTGRPPLVGVPPFVAILLLQLALAYLILGAGYTLVGSGGRNLAGNPIGVDFAQYYAASALTLDGEAAAVYDRERLYRAEAALFEGEVGQWPWSYPPTALLLVLPLALLPYLWALGLWLGGGLAAFLYAAWRAAPHPWTLALAILYPAVGNSLFAGQNGCLTGALIGGGLVALRRRPWLAGVLFGLLTFKPQLGVLLPVALAAGGHGRAFAGAALTAAAFAGLSVAAFGPGPWQGFFDALGFVAGTVEARETALSNMPTWFAAVALPGGPVPLAYAVQAAMTLAAAGFVAWLWHRPVAFELKAAGLVLALPLATPYAQFYDLAMLAFALLWLGIAARDAGWRQGEKLGLALLWLAPVGCFLLARWLGLQLWPLLLAGLLVLVWRRAVSPDRRRASSSP